ncbi:MAG: hypothetical protein FWD71_18715 [Oscillospiraceae bacterium]|nr:hypothetical protein [Oscillospiraceae bacterium]
MKNMHNNFIEINIDDTNGSVILTDKLRGMNWVLDGNVNDNLKFEYILHDNFVEIKYIYTGDESVKSVTMPSAFSPSGSTKKYLFPIMQGMLWDTADKTFTSPFESYRGEAGHHGFSMPMFAILGDNGGLVYISETQDDCHWLIKRYIDGKTRCDNIQTASTTSTTLRTMRYDRVGRIYFTDPSITKAAKCYKTRVIEKGRFATFREKIEKFPSIGKLFGALMCYIGYCQDDIDYVENFRKLKAYGFERALVYPVRFNTYTQDFKMGGVAPINLSDAEIAAIKDLGYDVAPWTWINEAIDDGGEYINGMYRANPDGSKNLTWQIDDFKYYNICTSFMEEFYLAQKKTTMKDMTWDHFDVVTCATNNECHAKNHAAHMGRPLTKTEDREYIRKLLLCARENTGAVSSESFNDAYSIEYDIGSVKAWAQYDSFMFKPIPLTMLVYHDSMIHSWWEVHNYNSKYFGGDYSPFYQYGGGRYDLQATMDALYGLPPDVMPFGAQYCWTGNGSETMLYRFRFDDTETQHALKIALPVAKNHAKVGMLEMTGFEFLTNNYNLQRTTFEDGTTIYANFGLNIINHPDCGVLLPRSWMYGKK